jgi:hypothetical protein
VTQRARLRPREIAFAVAIGALAAGGAAFVYDREDEAAVRAAPAAELAPAPLAPFDSISTIGPQDVIFSPGESHAIRIEEGDAAERYSLSVEDGVLTIRPRSGFRPRFRNGFRWGNRLPTVYVTAPQLNSVSLIGSGDVTIEHVEGPRFAASLSGPGDLNIGSLTVEEADLSLSGPGDLVASGTAIHARLALAGPGDIKADDLSTRTAAITLRGSGDAELTVSDDAQISIIGSGDVEIDGTASCQVSRFGPGDARCDSD